MVSDAGIDQIQNKKKRYIFIFFLLFLIVQFFIIIGEWTTKLLFSPYYAILFIIKSVSYFKNRFILKQREKQFFEKKAITFKQKHIFSFSSIISLIQKILRNIFFLLIKTCSFIGLLLIKVSKISIRSVYLTGKKIIRFFLFIVLLPYKLFIGFFSLEFRFFLLGFVVSLLMMLIYQGYVFIVNLPSPKNIGKVNFAQSTHLYDRNGKLLYEIYRDENRTPIKLKNIPEYVKKATIAIEDKDFFKHNGVSFSSGILRAIKETLITKSLQGGSTITQQLVKSSLLTPERTITRKIKEIILALWTEKLFSKEEILEMYFNQVPYGGSSYGIEEAAKTYFGKSAHELKLEEAALLAGLPQQPSIYSPYVNPDLAVKRRNDVLKKMKEQSYITSEQMEKAIKTPLEVIPLVTTIKAPHFVFYTKSNLEKKFGVRMVEEGGLNVVTTLDLAVQEEAEKIVKEELQKVTHLNVTNAAVLVTKPQTGEIIAMVGSSDYFAQPSGAFNVTTALRQPGSSIKPIMYSLALQKGFTAASILDDSPVSFSIPGSVPYRPVNYDGTYHGKVPLRYALANSFNITAVRTLNAIGVDSFVNYARKMGITTWDDPSRFGLSLTLGGGEVHMTDMATAFGVFANGGNKVDVADIIQVTNSRDQILYKLSVQKKKIISEEIAYIMSDILSDNFARRWAFGTNSALEIPGYKVAVKTGTTDEKKDNWTIGYTPEFLVAVWVGNNDNTPMNQLLASGITGAAPIWNRIMKYMLTTYGSTAWFQKPKDIVEKTCYFGKVEYFEKGTETKADCRGSLFGVSITPTKNP